MRRILVGFVLSTMLGVFSAYDANECQTCASSFFEQSESCYRAEISQEEFCKCYSDYLMAKRDLITQTCGCECTGLPLCHEMCMTGQDTCTVDERIPPWDGRHPIRCTNCKIPTQNVFKPDGCSVPDAVCTLLGIKDKNAPSGVSFLECCNQHDLCYQTCNSIKSDCDLKLANCMTSQCSTAQGNSSLMSSCLSWSKKYSIGIEDIPIVSTKYFEQDQSQACVCTS
jgi:hypothetical protein